MQLFLPLLSLAITLPTTLAQTQGYVKTWDAICTAPTANLVFEGPAPDNCQFSACTTFSGAGIAHAISFQRPRHYVGENDVLYGNYTNLMYATKDCSGASQLVTVIHPSEENCGDSVASWKSFVYRFGQNC